MLNSAPKVLLIVSISLMMQVFSAASANHQDTGLLQGSSSSVPGSESADVALIHEHQALSKTQPFLVIETKIDRFFLYSDQGTLLTSGPCSTGSDAQLVSPQGRVWRFSTPRGEFRIHFKARRPVWRKPDWAYIEEHQSVPPSDSPERLQEGLLGPCALDIGNGYLVHGSPYRRGIGIKNTHGCIRLLDEDLEQVYRTLNIGNSVFIH